MLSSQRRIWEFTGLKYKIATDFTPKKRSLLSDEAIDDLIFEKGFFENEEWKYL